MPVESRDDLVKRLREKITSGHSRGCQGREYSCDCGYDISIEGLLELAATRIASDAKRIAELEAAVAEAVKAANNSFEACREFKLRAETAERALAEERERHQWRTIDSAPKDGSDFLAWGKRHGQRITYYATFIDNLDGGKEKACFRDVFNLDRLPELTLWKPLDIPDATAIRSGKPDGKE